MIAIHLTLLLFFALASLLSITSLPSKSTAAHHSIRHSNEHTSSNQHTSENEHITPDELTKRTSSNQYGEQIHVNAYSSTAPNSQHSIRDTTPIPTSTAFSQPNYSYDESSPSGPQKWHLLNPEWSDCWSSYQSPIDILTQHVPIERNANKPLLNYPLSSQSKVINDGHKIAVDPVPTGSLTVDFSTYSLKSIFVRQPSEHSLNGLHSDLELQLLHYSSSHGWLCLSILMSLMRDAFGSVKPESLNADNAFLASLNWAHLPHVGNFTTSQSSINLLQALPQSLSYYTYEGSLTYPPCSACMWLIFKESIPVSANQLTIWRNRFGAQRTIRPIQPLNGRNVTLVLFEQVVQQTESVSIGRDVLVALIGLVVILSLILTFSVMFLCLRVDSRSSILGQAAAFYGLKGYDALPQFQRHNPFAVDSRLNYRNYSAFELNQSPNDHQAEPRVTRSASSSPRSADSSRSHNRRSSRQYQDPESTISIMTAQQHFQPSCRQHQSVPLYSSI